MIRGAGALLQAVQHGQAASMVAASRSLSTAAYTFSSATDAPPAAGSSDVSVSIKADGQGTATVEVKAGKGTAKASYGAAAARKAQVSAVELYDTPRISVLHASFQEYLLRLAHERYELLSSWPDFSKMFGKDYYYRAHPDEVRKFNSLVDEFHRMWGVLTEFDSLAGLATQMMPAYKKRHHNVLGPSVSPTVANGVLTRFLLAKAQ